MICRRRFMATATNGLADSLILDRVRSVVAVLLDL
jgi:hypothetical protein